MIDLVLFASLILGSDLESAEVSRTASCFPSDFEATFEVNDEGNLQVGVNPGTISTVVYSIESLDNDHYDLETSKLQDNKLEIDTSNLLPGKYDITIAGLCKGRRFLTGREPIVRTFFIVEKP